MRALEKDSSGNMTVFEAGSTNPVVTYPKEVLYDAASRMLRSNVGRLPVCSWEDPGARSDTWDALRSWQHACAGWKKNLCVSRDG